MRNQLIASILYDRNNEWHFYCFFMLLTHLEIAQQQEMFTQKEFESFLIVSIFFTFFWMLFSEFPKQ